VTLLPAFQAHLRAVAANEQHVAALWTLLGIDYAALKAEDRARAEALPVSAVGSCYDGLRARAGGGRFGSGVNPQSPASR
jgi:hypothetical protein